MKSLIKSIQICLESLLDDDDIFLDPENDKKDIENWIKNNYKIHGKLTISDDFVVDCSDTVEVKNRSITSLTNDLFRWGVVEGRFCCRFCKNLKTLGGAPKEVGESFDCSYCENLTSLEGGPKEVGSLFICAFCENLKSLEGAPEKVNGYFYCDDCKKLKITDSDLKKYKIVQ